MKRKNLAKILAVACAGVLMIAALAGCAQQGSRGDQDQLDRRQYMSQVNQAMDDLQTKLDSFSDAVSRDDVVGMRTQADNAFKALDDLNGLEVPDALKDIQQEYVDGTNSLKDALNGYIDLYTEIESATDEHPFDWVVVRSAHRRNPGAVRCGRRQAQEGRRGGQREGAAESGGRDAFPAGALSPGLQHPTPGLPGRFPSSSLRKLAQIPWLPTD